MIKTMLKEKIKSLIVKKEDEGNSKKTIENMIIFVVILIITILAINGIWKGNKNQKAETKDSNKKLATKTQIEDNEEESEEKNKQKDLESILSNISGVGNVRVLLTYSQTSQTIPLYNEDSKISNTEEMDKQGGNRKISETDSKREVIFQEVNGESLPVIQSIVQPKIEGAIITAEGANDLKVKEYIIQAVEAATGLATHKIQVFEMQKSN